MLFGVQMVRVVPLYTVPVPPCGACGIAWHKWINGGGAAIVTAIYSACEIAWDKWGGGAAVVAACGVVPMAAMLLGFPAGTSSHCWRTATCTQKGHSLKRDH